MDRFLCKKQSIYSEEGTRRPAIHTFPAKTTQALPALHNNQVFPPPQKKIVRLHYKKRMKTLKKKQIKRHEKVQKKIPTIIRRTGCEYLAEQAEKLFFCFNCSNFEKRKGK